MCAYCLGVKMLRVRVCGFIERVGQLDRQEPYTKWNFHGSQDVRYNKPVARLGGQKWKGQIGDLVVYCEKMRSEILEAHVQTNPSEARFSPRKTQYQHPWSQSLCFLMENSSSRQSEGTYMGGLLPIEQEQF